MNEFLIAHIGHTGKWDEHVCWWKPNSRGYTICVDKAGRYSEAEARSICQHGECIAVPVAAAEALALTTPYFPAYSIEFNRGDKGMSLRDYFAAKALPNIYSTAMVEASDGSGLFSDPDWRVGLALDAYAMADAMLKARGGAA